MNNMTNAWPGYAVPLLFIMAYALVILEDRLHLRKSKPVILFGCLIWMVIGIYEAMNGGGEAEAHVKKLVGEIAELFFFLFAAMTYVNVLQERLVFDSLRAWLVRKGFTYRTLFIITGIITFFLSAVADNLTSALLMAMVINAVEKDKKEFIIPAYINVIVAANAGGAWSPFGDITTLMVWTSGKVGTFQFLKLLLPSIINWGIPAFIMLWFLPIGTPSGRDERVAMKEGARRIIIFGLSTIAIAISFHQFLHLPPVMGMMTGLGLLMFLGFHLQRRDRARKVTTEEQFNIFRKIERIEYDTLLFFFGILSAVGGLQYIGYLSLISEMLYGGMGNVQANILIGVLSAVLDNIPLMYAVIQMDPKMDVNQWLLITLAAGTGGSLLSIGSAAGVAVMGVRRDIYTFVSHLKWAPVIALGYFASIGCWWLISG